MKSVIVGTAGHIDHGKTALVKALTGIDADRLEEEKRRGITIDLGFAHLELPGANREMSRFGFVDVPGHERFVRNMLAGVGGIDLVLLVIAADEGIKPQTREHFDICRLLAIPRGITVLTKCDLVDAERLAQVQQEVSLFLRGSFLDQARSPMIAVSSHSGVGLDALKKALVQVAEEIAPRNTDAVFRLPVDRVFAMKGFGTVVTGTLISGTIKSDVEVEALPGGLRARVRGIETHGEQATTASAGQRTAVNLAGVEKDALARGDVLTVPGTLAATSKIDAKISLLADACPLKQRSRVHLHTFTAETVAEVVLLERKECAPGSDAYAHLRLAQPILMLPGDRFIIRQFSPVVTIGGGLVLDAFPWAKNQAPGARVDFLRLLETAQPQDALLARVSRRHFRGLSFAEARHETGWTDGVLDAVSKQLSTQNRLLRLGSRLVASSVFSELQAAALAEIKAFQEKNRLASGVGAEQLREKLGIS